MIRAVIVCPDQNLTNRLQQALAAFRGVGIARVLHQYPNEAKLPAFLNASVPDLVFLSAHCTGDAIDVAARIHAQIPGTPIVALHDVDDGPTMLEMLRAGVKDFLTPPFEPRAIQAMLERVEAAVAIRPEIAAKNAPILAFLPAKTGAGTTTIAVNTSLALARIPERRVLLIDLDLNSGLVGFMLSLKPEYSVADAAENAADMDEDVWSKLVASVDNLDVLPAETIPRPGFRIESAQIRRILEFAQRNYDAICVDLSGMMEKYSVEVLERAEQVFLVCTPEIASLHLGGGKLKILRELQLEDRVRVLVNRIEMKQRAIAVPEIEKIFGQKVFLALPNAYEIARQALVDGKSVKLNSELGMCFTRLAQTILPAPEPIAQQRRSMLDIFARHKKVEAPA